jgi:hypothetical protein
LVDRRPRDPAELRLAGRIGALRLHATHDPRETTASARQAFRDSFEREVDPAGVLPDDERRRRADFARRAHFARLARLSALARRSRRPEDRE